ncbi:unnamed protein product, partial [marine sediment metagenome]
GRFRGDTELALDPKQFDNLQLRITYNSALWNAGATATGIEVHAECFDEKEIIPIGFLQTREYERHVPTVAAAVHEVELPVDRVIRKLIVQPFDPGVTAANNMGIVRLDEDNDKRVVFDLAQARFLEFQRKWYNRCHQYCLYVAVQGGGNPLFAAPSDTGLQNLINASGILAIQSGAAVGGQFACITATNTDLLYGEVYGDCPYQMFSFPMGDQNKIEDWYDVTRVGDLRLRIAAGLVPPGTGSTRTILQQLRRY